MKHKITIEINAETEAQAKEIANGLQKASAKVKGGDLVKMLKKLEKNPQWIKMAVMFC